MSTPKKTRKRKSKPKKQLEIIIPSQMTSDELFSYLNKYKNYFETENDILKEYEKRNIDDLKSNTNFNYLYPHQDDPNFNKKIISKKEFYDLIHDKPHFKTENDLYNISEKICNQQIFELMPHQLFVRNYLSFNTPYNSLLLFHGLGTGKTCSAISITEMMRTYLNQIGVSKRILIVASPNVQTNFKIQLFNPNKLKEINGYWNLNDCTGDKFLKEINPMNMKGLNKIEITKLINRIIKQSYIFMGHEQFSNYIQRILDKGSNLKQSLKILNNEFSDRMIVIDEVHNMRNISDSPKKKTVKNLLTLVKSVDNLKLLLLTATPMFNSNEEIIWLLNLMNANDKRPTIQYSDVFDTNGNLKIIPHDSERERYEDGDQIGKNILIQKSRSYISYIRGENPYTFPFKITPKMFMNANTMNQYIKPQYELNGRKIENEDEYIKFMDLTITKNLKYQDNVYTSIVNSIKEELPKSDVGIGYQRLSLPLQALTITYPYEKYDNGDDDIDYREMVGKLGIKRIMEYNSKKRKFKYKTKILDKYGRIFSKEKIMNYSSKISFICDKIMNSDGIILIYSQYIDGGCLPVALALEELGFVRYGAETNLFNTKPADNIDSITLKNTDVKDKASYAMITGDILLSPNNEIEIKALTDSNNINGEKIKVVIISEAGSEGIDLKCVRQVHIIDPWFNLARIEQIVGRSIRNCSHKLLPFNKRNVEVHLYATQLIDTKNEAADIYVYKLAESKAIKIGIVNRILKENSIDCVINKNIINNKLKTNIKLSSKNIKPILYEVRDKAYSYVCDYMDNCDYKCNVNIRDIKHINNETYDETFINYNVDIIINKIKDLFSEGYAYSREDIFTRIQHIKPYSGEQIFSALSRLVNNNNEIVFDYFNNKGKIVNIGNYYLFNPLNITSKHITSYERMNPIKKYNKKLRIMLSDKYVKKSTISEIIKNYINDFNDANKLHTGKKPGSKGDQDIDWYISAGNFFYGRNVIQIDKDLFNEFVIKHLFDTIDFEHKIQIIEYILNKDISTDFDKYLFNVIDKYYKIQNKYFYIGNYKTNSIKYFTLKNTEVIKLNKSTPTEVREIIEYINTNVLENIKDNLNETIGFIGNFKKKYNVFKIKNTTSKRDKGYRADQRGKRDILEVLNNLKIPKISSKGKEKSKKYIVYNNENTSKISNAKELCVDQEIILRYYDYIKKDGKRWFLSYEEYIISTKSGYI